MSDLPPRPVPTNYVSGIGSGTLVGSTGNDQISGATVEYGLAGDDILFGADGGDRLYGGDGNDYVFGGIGNNLLDAGNGNNVVYGGAGNDLVVLGTGDNTVYGAAGVNTVALPELINQSTVNLNYGNPTVTGPAGTESLYQVGTLRFLDGTLTTDPDSSLGQAERLYQAAFGRVPDLGGLAYWSNALDSGVALTNVAQAYISSGEFATRYGTLNDNDFVAALYTNVLGRTPDSGGTSYWVGLLSSGSANRAQVLTGFSESNENRNNTSGVYKNGLFAPSENAIQIVAAYQTVLGRTPDAGSLTYWASQLAAGLSNANLVGSLIASAEFQGKPGVGNASGFAGQIVQNTEGGADVTGTNYWAGQINAGAATRVDVASAYVNSALAQTNAVALLQTGFKV